MYIPHTLPNTFGVRAEGIDHDIVLARERRVGLNVDTGMARIRVVEGMVVVDSVYQPR